MTEEIVEHKDSVVVVGGGMGKSIELVFGQTAGREKFRSDVCALDVGGGRFNCPIADDVEERVAFEDLDPREPKYFGFGAAIPSRKWRRSWSRSRSKSRSRGRSGSIIVVAHGCHG